MYTDRMHTGILLHLIVLQIKNCNYYRHISCLAKLQQTRLFLIVYHIRKYIECFVSRCSSVQLYIALCNHSIRQFPSDTFSGRLVCAGFSAARDRVWGLDTWRLIPLTTARRLECLFDAFISFSIDTVVNIDH